MGEEIEIYILKRLDDAINESKASSEYNFAARLVIPKPLIPDLHKDFTDVRDLIKRRRAKIKSKVVVPAGGAEKESEANAPSAGGSEKEPEANPPSAGGSEKEIGTCKNAGDDKESGPLLNAGDDDKESGEIDNSKNDTGETDAPSGGDDKESGEIDNSKNDTGETDAPSAGDDKESSAPSDAGKKESSGPGDEKEAGAPLADSGESKASTPAITSGDKNESPSAKTTSQDESKASTPRGDKNESIVAKTTSQDEAEISTVTDSGVTDHKSKTPPISAAIPPPEKSAAIAPPEKSTTKTGSEEDLLREQLYYINNVLTEWQMITKKPFPHSLSSIRELSKDLKKIKLDLKLETTKKPGESSNSGIPPAGLSDNASVTRTTPQVGEFRWSTRVNLRKVHGFEDKILSLERLLVLRRKDSDTFKAFGLHGMAGVGKTTLCQSIFSRPKVTEYFFPRIWVCLSKQNGEDEDPKKEVVKRMLRCLGIDDKIINKVDEKQSIRGLLFALRLQLTGKRYFIVLDDAHNPDEWFKMPDSDAENDNNKIYEKFSFGLPKECGGTVLVTSRVEQVVKNMVGEEENLRCIKPLTDQESCWNIFKDTVEEDGTRFPPDLEKLKLEIVKRCDGLPLAAKLLGQIKHEELSKNPTAAINHRPAVEAAT